MDSNSEYLSCQSHQIQLAHAYFMVCGEGSKKILIDSLHSSDEWLTKSQDTKKIQTKSNWQIGVLKPWLTGLLWVLANICMTFHCTHRQMTF